MPTALATIEFNRVIVPHGEDPVVGATEALKALTEPLTAVGWIVLKVEMMFEPPTDLMMEWRSNLRATTIHGTITIALRDT